VNAESSLKIFQLKRQKLWLDQNGVKTNSKWIEPKRESVCLKVLYFGLKDRKCFSHLTPLPYYLISLLVYLLYGVGSTTCIYFIIYCITTELVWPLVSILSFITLLRSQFYFYYLLHDYGVGLTTYIYLIIYCIITELVWPPVSILSFIALLMWTSSRLTRPNNEREPKNVLRIDSNGRPRPVVYYKQELRYKEDSTNGGGTPFDKSIWTPREIPISSSSSSKNQRE
jgi:hypothetical protein